MTARFTVIVIAKMWNSILSLSFMGAAPFRPPRQAASVRRFLAIRGAAKSLFGFHAARGRRPKVLGPLSSRRTEGLSSLDRLPAVLQTRRTVLPSPRGEVIAMIDKPVYKGEVYRDTVKMAQAAIEAGSLKDAESVSSFIDAVFAKLCDVRGEAVPYDEFAQYDKL